MNISSAEVERMLEKGINNEANEINIEDLEAAAACFDRLLANSK